MECQYTLDPNYFKIRKPMDWNRYPMFKKIRYYGTHLTQVYAPFVDKLYSKKIVKDICGDLIEVPAVVRILKDCNDIHETDICDNHILKPAHGCGDIIDFSKIKSISEIKALLIKNNCLYKNHHFEKQYSYLTPRFFIEEKVHDKYSGLTSKAYTFKFRCFYGEPKLIIVKIPDGFVKYDIDWKLIDKSDIYIEKPVEFDKMIEIAKLLSKPFEFVRIDLYIGDSGKIYFSEFTFTPSAGTPFYTMGTEIQQGKFWK